MRRRKMRIYTYIHIYIAASFQQKQRLRGQKLNALKPEEHRDRRAGAIPHSMATKAATKRLSKEYKALEESPPPLIEAHPSEQNILEWHYLLTGPPGTPYDGGQYHGMLIFPRDYPFKPPEIRMITPNGRFHTNTRLCLSMSDYHPDTWQPAWSVATILTGLLSFMTGGESTTGAVSTSVEMKRRYARASWSWNANDSPMFKREFSELCESNLAKVRKWEQEDREQKEKEQRAKEQVRVMAAAALAEMDPEDRIRFLAAQQPRGSHTFVYYLLAVAVVLGFFRVVS